MDDKQEKTPLLESTHEVKVLDPAAASKDSEAIKTYWWRWTVLLVFALVMGVNNSMWIAFAPIANVVGCYYNVHNFWVNSLSMVYMATYLLFFIPCAWILNRLGLRTTTVIAGCLSAIGGCLRVAGTGKTLLVCVHHPASLEHNEGRCWNSVTPMGSCRPGQLPGYVQLQAWFT